METIQVAFDAVYSFYWFAAGIGTVTTLGAFFYLVLTEGM